MIRLRTLSLTILLVLAPILSACGSAGQQTDNDSCPGTDNADGSSAYYPEVDTTGPAVGQMIPPIPHTPPPPPPKPTSHPNPPTTPPPTRSRPLPGRTTHPWTGRPHPAPSVSAQPTWGPRRGASPASGRPGRGVPFAPPRLSTLGPCPGGTAAAPQRRPPRPRRRRRRG